MQLEGMAIREARVIRTRVHSAITTTAEKREATRPEEDPASAAVLVVAAAFTAVVARIAEEELPTYALAIRRSERNAHNAGRKI